MTDRPLLMSAPMVLATLALRKDVTRRVITRSNSTVDGSGASEEFWEQLDFSQAVLVSQSLTPGLAYLNVPSTAKKYDGAVHRVRPRIEPRDDLWVRETWRLNSRGTHETMLLYEADQSRATFSHSAIPSSWKCPQQGLTGGRVPGIYLPRWASRIIRPVLTVRPEQVQEITEEDAKREGVEMMAHVGAEQGLAGGDGDRQRRYGTHPYTISFACLWDKINSKRGYPWVKNNWVWRIEFSKTNAESKT